MQSKGVGPVHFVTERVEPENALPLGEHGLRVFIDRCAPVLFRCLHFAGFFGRLLSANCEKRTKNDPGQKSESPSEFRLHKLLVLMPLSACIMRSATLEWNQKTFAVLYQLFQMSVSSVASAGPSIT